MNYLRNGDLLCPEDRTVRKELLAEATFYQVQGIITHLKEKMSAFECSSVIETKNHHSALISWLPPYATCSLLFRASDDGKTPADFHRCCDNKGPTLVLIKSEEYIFGGYTVQSWDSGTKVCTVHFQWPMRFIDDQLNLGFITHTQLMDGHYSGVPENI